MKKYLFLCAALTTTFVSSVAFSIQKNPQIITCNTLGGEFLVANTHNDEIGFCQFDKALVGAVDLMIFNDKVSIPQSLNSYMKYQSGCYTPGSIETLFLVGGRGSLQFCAYPDHSYIELGTLIKGPDSLDNEKLNEVLGL